MHKTLSTYLTKQALYNGFIKNMPKAGLQLIVTIPAYNEPYIFNTLTSLKKCTATQNPTEVLVLINHAQHSPEPIISQNKKTYSAICEWAIEHSSDNLRFYAVILPNLPPKHAGAGLARKIIMDEAILRFNLANNPNGIIASLDADTTVSENYLFEIQAAFTRKSKLECAVFSFEHQISPQMHACHKKAITLYELYLRYFKQALKHSGFPYPYHTIGSCFAVKASTYAKQGGMSRKQAGEDFYFLQKIFPLDSTVELNHVTVYPSARISDRVPFGTGPALQKIIADGNLLTYKPIYFDYLKTLFSKAPLLYRTNSKTCDTVFQSLHFTLRSFIKSDFFLKKIDEINSNSASEKSFLHRFFLWFDAFRIIKYLNFAHITTEKIPIEDAAYKLAKKTKKTRPSPSANLLPEYFKKLEHENP